MTVSIESNSYFILKRGYDIEKLSRNNEINLVISTSQTFKIESMRIGILELMPIQDSEEIYFDFILNNGFIVECLENNEISIFNIEAHLFENAISSKYDFFKKCRCFVFERDLIFHGDYVNNLYNEIKSNHFLEKIL